MVLDVNLFQTEELCTYCQNNNYSTKYQAAENVKTALEAVCDDIGINMDITVRNYSSIDPPEEKRDWDNWYYLDPCNTDNWSYYNKLFNWWQVKLNCLYSATDSNLLLSNTGATGGGWGAINSGDGEFAVAPCGQKCADADLPNSFDQSDFNEVSDEYSALETAIHEVGHNVIEPQSNDSCDDSDHDCGSCDQLAEMHHTMGGVRSEPAGNAYYPTPMSANYYDCMTYKDGANFCDTDIMSESYLSGYDLRFSSCTQSHIND